MGVLRSVLACAGLLLACASRQVTPRSVTPLSGYLRTGPAEVTGDLAHVKQATWCAPDGAFALELVPFPDGPTQLQDVYGDGGVTCTLNMYDAHERLVQVVRTKIRSDLPAESLLSDKIAPSLERTHQTLPEVRWEWIRQGGLTQIQSINVAPNYSGKESAIYLSMGQGVSQRQDSCRVDRHFVAAGYYFQIIALAYHAAASEPCKVAEELAGWTVAHLRPGVRCP